MGEKIAETSSRRREEKIAIPPARREGLEGKLDGKKGRGKSFSRREKDKG